MVFRTYLIVCVLVLVAAGVFVAAAWHPAIGPIDPPQRNAFAPTAIEKGAELAALGSCDVCHTSAVGKSYAGGRALPTPFGTIYSTNITPDPETGIGRWSLAAFTRALRAGVDRGGNNLYPAFPYDHFTKLTDADITALYAFFMTRDPVRNKPPANELSFPLNFRFTVAAWNLLFLHQGAAPAVPGQSAEWERGAYLVEGVAHCGACHSPRNALGAEIGNAAFAGGSAEGWDAPALNAASPAPIPWDVDHLFTFLRTGFAARHSIALGPMAPVVGDLAGAPASDVHAIATYVATLAGAPSPERLHNAQALIERVEHPGVVKTIAVQGAADMGTGALIYAGACAACHENRAVNFTSGLDLAFSSSVAGPTPRNVIHTILDGIKPPDGEAGHRMPGFAAALTDAQVSALVTYLRERFGSGPAWSDIQTEVRKIREGKEKS
jgi:mono/diheme cytochrome c family protein